MKRLLFMAAAGFAALMFQGASGYAAGKPIDAPIKRVTVFSELARIARIAKLTLPAGDHTLLVEQIPIAASEASFRASASGAPGITILGLSHKQVEHLEPPQERVAALQKEIKRLESGPKKVLSDHLAAFSEQRELMTAISKKAGDQMAWQVGKADLSVSKWDEAYRYVGRQLRAIDDSMRLVQNQLAEIDNQLEQLSFQLERSQDPQSKSSRTVQIDLHLEQAGEIEVTLEYMVPGATWKPLYDARLIGDSGEVELAYLAEVTQHTGEDWNEVTLTLSTATPSRGTGPGEFMPRYFSEYTPPESDAMVNRTIRVSADKDIIPKFETANPIIISARPEFKGRPTQTVDNLLRQVAGVRTNQSGQIFIRSSRPGEVSYIVDGVPIGDPLGGVGSTGGAISLGGGSFSDMNVGNSGYGPWSQSAGSSGPVIAEVANADIRGSNSSATFMSQRKETIPSGNTSIRTTVGRWALSGRMELLSRPRNVDGAYRIVTITNQASAPLLPGKVAVFVESDFLGNAQLNEMIAPNESFELPFGLDGRLSVSRKLWSFKKTESRGKTRLDYIVRIMAVNHAVVDRTLHLEEPLPVSRDGRVKIELGDVLPRMTSVDIAGRGIWLLSIKPGDSAMVNIPIRMEYPSGMQIAEQ